jgi:hypothetical protein
MKRLWNFWLAAIMLGILGGAAQAQTQQQLPATNEVVIQSEPIAPVPQTTTGPVYTEFAQSCPQDSGGGITLGIGFYYIQPFFESNPAITFNNVNAAGNVTTVISDVNWNYEVAPRLFAGYTGESGFGGRVSWWQFDQAATGLTAINTDPGFATAIGVPNFGGLISVGGIPAGQADVINVNSGLDLDVWDFDLTQQCQLGRVHLLLGGGIRYTWLAQDYTASIVRVGGAGPNIQLLETESHLNVAGPNLFLDAVRPVSNILSLYGNVRSGVLFGTGGERQLFTNNVGGVIFTNLTEAQRDEVLPFVETELGVELSGNTGGLNPFMRVGVVGQGWFGAGNAGQFGPGGNTGNLGFFGLSVLVGTNF